MQSYVNRLSRAWHNKYFWIFLFAIIFIAAAFIRGQLYLNERSLHLDEANLAMNFADRSYAGLFDNLDHRQYAPPLFSVVMKSMTDVFGMWELSLRFLPVLASLIFLGLYFRVAQRLTDIKFALIPVLFFCFTFFILRLSTEVKQYSTDMMTTALLLYLALQFQPAKLKVKTLIAWAVGGAAVVWWSMPSVFILTGVGLYLLWVTYQNGGSRNALKWLPVIGCWLLSFGIYYLTILQFDIGSEYLQNYHATYYFNPLPLTAEAVERQSFLITTFLGLVPGKSTLALTIIYAGLALSLYFLIRHQPAYAILLLVPVIACLTASALHMYSLIPRVTIFLMPVIILLFCYGWFQVIQRLPVLAKIPIIAALLFMVYAQANFQYFTQPIGLEPVKKVLRYINDKGGKHDFIYVHYEGYPVLEFYTEYYAGKEEFQYPNMVFGHWSEKTKPPLKEFAEGNSSFDQVWMVFNHVNEERIDYAYNHYYPDLGKPVDRIDLWFANAYLHEKPTGIE